MKGLFFILYAICTTTISLHSFQNRPFFTAIHSTKQPRPLYKNEHFIVDVTYRKSNPYSPSDYLPINLYEFNAYELEGYFQAMQWNNDYVLEQEHLYMSDEFIKVIKNYPG